MNHRKVIWVLCCLLGAVFALFAIHFYFQIRVVSYMASLKAKGEPVELSQVIPKKVPDNQNGAFRIVDVLTNDVTARIETNHLFVPLSVAIPGKAIVVWRQPELLSDGVTNAWLQVAEALAGAKANLEAFQQIANTPVLDFNLDYERNWTIELVHLSPLRHAIEWLGLSSLNSLHEGRVIDADGDVHAMLALVKGLADEPLKTSQQIRLAMLYDSADATWELLQATNLSEECLAALQHDWESLEIIKPTEHAYLMERVLADRELEHYRAYPDELWRYVSGPRQGIEWMLAKFYWRWYSAYTDEYQSDRVYQVLIDAARMIEAGHSFQAAQRMISTNFLKLGQREPKVEDEFIRIDIDAYSVGTLCSYDAWDSFHLLARAAAAENTRNLVMAAIAIKRYELCHSQLPESLAVLQPDFLASPSIDWMNGSSLHYRCNPDGTYLLYSVGFNGDDDNGDSNMPVGSENHSFYWENFYARDLVWPQPATDEEVKEYYAKQAAKGN